jgi:hypothetical protein
MIIALFFAAVALPAAGSDAVAEPAETAPLQLEAKIPLGNVRGRIDHMAVDLKRQRLFVPVLGNDTVAVVDLAKRTLIQTITGLREPQGVGYEPSTDMLYVANAGDGSVRSFEGSNYKTTGRIELGRDADNIRVDAAAKRIFIGYGSGALAVIDPSTRSKVGDILLKAHPESFQIDPDTGQIFVNVPDARGIAVVDRVSQKQIGKWSLADRGANFPMALDHVRRQILVIFRAPAELGVFSMTDGKSIATAETCGDADDLFVDAKRARASTSVAGRASLTSWRRKKRRIDGSRVSPRFRVRALRSLYPRRIVCLSRSERVPESPQPSGSSDQCLESIAAALRTNACLRSGRIRN